MTLAGSARTKTPYIDALEKGDTYLAWSRIAARDKNWPAVNAYAALATAYYTKATAIGSRVPRPRPK